MPQKYIPSDRELKLLDYLNGLKVSRDSRDYAICITAYVIHYGRPCKFDLRLDYGLPVPLQQQGCRKNLYFEHGSLSHYYPGGYYMLTQRSGKYSTLEQFKRILRAQEGVFCGFVTLTVYSILTGGTLMSVPLDLPLRGENSVSTW